MNRHFILPISLVASFSIGAISACNPRGHVLNCASPSGEICAKHYNVSTQPNGTYWQCKPDGPLPNPVDECPPTWVGACEFGPAPDKRYQSQEQFWYTAATVEAFAAGCVQARGAFRYPGQPSTADAGSDAR